MCATVVAKKLPCHMGKPPKSEDVLMSCGVVGVALCDIRCVSAGLCVRDRRRVKLLCLWGEVPKRVFLDVSEDVFLVAGMAFCDIRSTDKAQ